MTAHAEHVGRFQPVLLLRVILSSESALADFSSRDITVDNAAIFVQNQISRGFQQDAW